MGTPEERKSLITEKIEEFWHYTTKNLEYLELEANKLAEYKRCVDQVMAEVDSGILRVAQRQDDGSYKVEEYVKKAVILYLRWNKAQLFQDGTNSYYDKVALKYDGWTEARFKEHNVRVVPGARVRYGSYIAPRCVILPSFVNLGAYIGEATMIDSYATVGSCAQIGSECHISSGAVIAGVIEPIQARPTIVEERVFVGAGSVVAEGVILRKNSVLAAGVSITASTPLYDVERGLTFYGEVPENAVVIPGVLHKNGYGGNSGIIVKYADFETRQKVGLNMLLRPEFALS